MGIFPTSDLLVRIFIAFTPDHCVKSHETMVHPSITDICHRQFDVDFAFLRYYNCIRNVFNIRGSHVVHSRQHCDANLSEVQRIASSEPVFIHCTPQEQTELVVQDLPGKLRQTGTRTAEKPSRRGGQEMGERTR